MFITTAFSTIINFDTFFIAPKIAPKKGKTMKSWIEKETRTKKISWRARIISDSGKVSKSFTKKAYATAWINKTAAAIESDTHREDSTNFGDVIDRYIREVGSIKKIGHSKMWHLLHIQKTLGHHSLKDLTTKVLMDFVMKRRLTVAPSTAFQEITYVGVVLKSAENMFGMKPKRADHLKGTEICVELGLIAPSEERDRRVSDKEIESILNNRGNTKIELCAWVHFSTHTSMRRGEIGSLMWDDLSSDCKSIIVRQRKHPRKKRDERVPLLPAAQKIIKAQRKIGPRIFMDKGESIGRAFERSAHAAGLFDIVFHDLRHEAISRLFEMGLDAMVVSVFSGHKDLNTLKRYTHLNASKVLDMLDNNLFKL